MDMGLGTELIITIKKLDELNILFAEVTWLSRKQTHEVW